MKLASSAFQDHEPIPKKYTGEGVDVSPPLHMDEVPSGTQTHRITTKCVTYMVTCAALCFGSSAFAMTITSSDFAEGTPIPPKFSCKGDNTPPSLSVKEIPEKTAALALIVVDPDAPGGHFVHWVAWNIPTNKEFSEGIKEGVQGVNGAGSLGYRGPCPPADQTHRYVFRVYALDTVVSLPDTSSREQLEDAIKGHILDTADLNGTFKKP